MHSVWSDLLSFILAYLSHWQSYATGGVVTGIIGVSERLSGKQLPKKYYAAIFIVAFSLVAFFLAWRDEYNSANQLRQSNIQLQTANDGLRQQLSTIEAKDTEIKQLRQRVTDLTPDQTSLKIRALRAADEMESLFKQREKHTPTCTQTSTMTPEQQRDAIMPCAKYNVETQTLYQQKFAPNVMAMVEEFKSKGIDVKNIENCASAGWCQIPVAVQLRAFAARLDAKDNVKR